MYRNSPRSILNQVKKGYWEFKKIILTFAGYVLKSADTNLYKCKI